MAKFYGHKKVPSFWWDFEGNEIIIESDIEGKSVVARFPFDPNDGREPTIVERGAGFDGIECKFGCAENAIELAEKLIEDLNTGRKSLKDILKNE